MREEFKLFVGEDQQFYFHLEAGNNKIILQSVGFGSKEKALSGIQFVRNNSDDDTKYVRKIAKNSEPYFEIFDVNGHVLCWSETYSSNQKMEQGIESVKKNAPDAPLVDDSTKQSNGNDFVTIKIKGIDYSIHRGSHSVESIKRLGNILVSYILVLITGDDIKPLTNDGKITIKGGEVFDCTPPNGSNS